MVSSTHWLASSSAMAVLERGGNAFDAAVAGAFVQHIVEPHLVGPGGDLVAIVAPAGEQPRVLAGQAPAPRGASVDSYRELGLELVPGAGLLAATAPGAFDAWLLLLRDHGTWDFGDVVAFALHYAETGHPVLPSVAASIDRVADLFTESWPTSAEAWLGDGAGENSVGQSSAGSDIRFRPEWAATLRRLSAAGTAAAGDGTGTSTRTSTREERIDAIRREWSTGFVAEAIAAFAATSWRDSSGDDHAGVLSAADLADYSATWEEPAALDFRGSTILKPGAWTQGPSLLQALSILDGFDDERLDPSSELGAHTILETLKLVLADRNAWYGDDGSTPLDALLSPAYAATRRAQITDDADPSDRPGEIDGHELRLPSAGVANAGAEGNAAGPAAGTGEPTVARDGTTRGDTCQIDVVDRWGNMISATPSGGWLQSSPHIPGLGFCLGTRLQMTWLEDGLPTSLRPGERPRTTLSPTLVVTDGQPSIALGTPGGDQQDQWQLPVLLRVLVGGYDLQQALDAPIFHSTSAAESFWPRQRIPGGAVVEERLGDDVIQALRDRGHQITVSGGWSLGRTCAVGRSSDLANGTSRLTAAANARGAQGYAVGR